MIGFGNKRAVTGGGVAAALLLTLAATLFPAGQAAAQVPASCPTALGTASLIEHDFSVSFCELCSVGTVRIVVENPFRQRDDLDFSQLVITENLLASGLTYVPNSTRFSGSGITPPAPVQPALSGSDNSILTWTLPPGFQLETAPNQGGPRDTLILEFDVRRNRNAEGLVRANRDIEATLGLTPSCAPAERFSTSSGRGRLPLREPYPRVDILGRNVDAGQDQTAYSEPVYGHENDDVIWRIEVHNTGDADLQDYIFSNSIVPGNFDINYVCDTESDATLAADGSAPARCVNVGSTTDDIGFSVAQAFGGGANPYIVAQAGRRNYYYLIGKITDSCTNRTSTVYDIEWGCQSQPPAGGIDQTSRGVSFSDNALLSTRSLESGLNIDVDLTGTNTAQPMGAKGTVTISIRNNSGGTIKGNATGIRLRDVLPAEYVIDTTFDPEVNMAPAYDNAYPGMIDTLQWTNPEPGTYPLTTTDPARPLANTDLEFLLTSSTVHPDFPDQFNMIRHGDVVTVTFRTVLIDPQY